jgi:hypothetical protein
MAMFTRLDETGSERPLDQVIEDAETTKLLGGTVNLPYTLSAPATNGADYGYDAPRNPDGLSGFLGLGRVGSWTIKDEPRQRISGGYKGSEGQIVPVSLNGAHVLSTPIQTPRFES